MVDMRLIYQFFTQLQIPTCQIDGDDRHVHIELMEY